MRKRVSFSTKLCESKTIVCPLDCDWKWSVSCGEKGEPCEDKWSDSGKNCGLRSERFAEHGSVYGAGGCDTIWQNLQDFGRSPEDYSRIITGDLGYVGQSILFDLLLGRQGAAVPAPDTAHRHTQAGRGGGFQLLHKGIGGGIFDLGAASRSCRRRAASIISNCGPPPPSP